MYKIFSKKELNEQIRIKTDCILTILPATDWFFKPEVTVARSSLGNFSLVAGLGVFESLLSQSKYWFTEVIE